MLLALFLFFFITTEESKAKLYCELVLEVRLEKKVT